MQKRTKKSGEHLKETCLYTLGHRASPHVLSTRNWRKKGSVGLFYMLTTLHNKMSLTLLGGVIKNPEKNVLLLTKASASHS